MQDVTELKVWQAAYRLALEVYGATRTDPKEEMFGLTSQTRRAASAVPANIAEGHGRFSRADFRRFCQIAHGSLCELDTHLRLGRDLKFLAPETWQSLRGLLLETKKMLVGFIRHLDEPAPP